MESPEREIWFNEDSAREGDKFGPTSVYFNVRKAQGEVFQRISLQLHFKKSVFDLIIHATIKVNMIFCLF